MSGDNANGNALLLEAEAAGQFSNASSHYSYAANGWTNGKSFVKANSSGAYLVFKGVDFAAGRFSFAQVRASAKTSGGKIELRKGSPTGPLLASIALTPSHRSTLQEPGRDWSVGLTHSHAAIDKTQAQGVADVYVVMSGTSSSNIPELDYLKLLPAQSATTWYVSPTGNDTGTNVGKSLSLPFKTIAKALAVADPGDTIVLRGGTYRERVNLPPTLSGFSDRRLTIQAHGTELPIIDGSTGVTVNGAHGEGLLDIRADYISVSGVSVRNSAGHGIYVNGDGVRIEKCDIRVAQYSGLSGNNANNLKVSGCEIQDTARMNLPYGAIQGGWPGALSVSESRIVEFSGNNVHDNHGEGLIALKEAHDFRIIGNRSFNNYSVGIYLDNAINAEVSRNVVGTDRSYAAYPASDFRKLPIGIVISDEDYKSQWGSQAYDCSLPSFIPGRGHSISNNIVVGTRHGLSFFGNVYPNVTCSALRSITFVNNTIANTWESPINVGAGNHTGNVFANNILHARADRQPLALYFCGTSTTRFLNNLFFRTGLSASTTAFGHSTSPGSGCGSGAVSMSSWQQTLTSSGGNTVGDPRLENVGLTVGNLSANHRLTSSSALAINSGTTTSAPAVDYFGSARPVGTGIDRGAHEFGGTPTSPVASPTTSPPTAPTAAPTAAPTPIPSPGQNLVQNGGLESGQAPWVDWGSSAVVSQNASAGTYAVRVGAPTSTVGQVSGGGLGQSITSGFAAGSRLGLTASGKVGAAGEKGWIGVKAYDGAGNTIGESSMEFTSTSYTRMSKEFVVPAGATKLDVFLWKNAGPSYLYGDEISLVGP